MLPFIIGGLFAVIGLVATIGGDGDDAPLGTVGKTPAAGDAKTAAKVKARPRRQMNAQEAFEAGKKQRDAEYVLETKAKADREAEIDAAVARRMRSQPRARAAPKADPPAGDEGGES